MSFLTTYSQHPVIIKSFTLQEIYKSIIDGSFFVPKFQRNYVWKPTMVVNLATSLIKGYPINSFVLMPKELVALGLNPASPLNKYKDDLSPNGYYVLDGQQRLTSIASIFVNKARNGYENPQTYYFDLVNLVSSHIKCDLLNQGLDILIEESESQKIEFITKKPKKDMEWRYLKCSDIFKPNFQKEFETFSENFIYALKNKVPELYQENIKFFEGNNNFFSQFNSLFNNLKNLEIASYVINVDDLSFGKDVFDVLNNSGVRLTTFELVDSKSYRLVNDNGEEGLREHGIADVLSMDLDAFLKENPQAEDLFKNLFKLKPDSKTEELPFNLYENLLNMLKFLLLTNAVSDFDESNIKTLSSNQSLLSNKDFLKVDSRFWFDRWKEVKDSFFKITKYFIDRHLHLCVSPLVTVFIFVFLHCLQEKFPDFDLNSRSGKYQKMLKYIEKVAIKHSTDGVALSRIFYNSFCQLYIDLFEYLNNLQVNSFENINALNNKTKSYQLEKLITKEDVYRSKNSSVLSNLLTYLAITQYDNKFQKDLGGVELKGCNFDLHHCFPVATKKNENTTMKGKYNSIANLNPLNSHHNQRIFGSIPFKTALLESKKFMDKKIFEHILEQNLIPKDFEKYEDNDLLDLMAELKVNYLNKFFTDSLEV